MAELNDVIGWLILSRNTGHVLTDTQHGWYATLCGTFTPNGTVTDQRPGRICRKCRERISQATIAPGASAETMRKSIADLMEWQRNRSRLMKAL